MTSTSPPLPTAADIEASILALTTARGPGKSISPSDVARALWPGQPGDGWQALLTPVRSAAVRLSQAGQVEILRKGKPVDAPAATKEVKGVIRLRQAAPQSAA